MKKIIKYILPSLVTLLILCFIFWMNHLFPFGKNPLIQVDADYQFIPVLYKIYDFLHHGSNIFYSDMGLGNSIYGSLIIQGSLFSPLNLLLYLVKRNDIIDYFGIFIVIKLCLITLTSYIYINNKYNKINYFYKVLFSIVYTFNGFVLFNYFNHMWLDIVILFPLLVMYLDRLLDNKGDIGYIVIVALSFIINAYFSMFVVIFILIYSFVNLYLYKKNDDIKRIVFRLGKASIIGFLISSFSSIPLLYQIFCSDRFNGDTYTEIFSSISMKSLYVLFSPILIVYFIKLLGKFKYDRINIYKYFLLVILYIIPLVIDPVNALMHGGSYWSFPYRYGFITSFILMDASLYYISKFNRDEKIKVNFIIISNLVVIVWFMLCCYFLNKEYRSDIISTGILLDLANDSYVHIIYIVITLFIMYMLIYFIRNKIIKYIILGVISVYSIIIVSNFTIYYNSGYFLCKHARDVYNNMDIKKDGRYKVEYTVYTPDYGYMFGVGTLDNWIHIIPKGIKEVYGNLGYYPTGTSIYSYGGTIFTDWLLNFKYNLSNDDKSNDDMFTLISNYNDKYLYRYDYTDSYGVVFDKIDSGLVNNGKINKFNYQNRVYRNLFNTDDDIIEYKNYNYDKVDNHIVTLNYNISNDGYLYLYNRNIDSIDYVMVDDKYIYDISEYIKYLGYYGKSVKIEVHLKDNYSEAYFDIGFINKDKVVNLKSNVLYKDNKYYVDSSGNEYLFLPINNVKGINVYNNGKKVKTLKYLDNFICIKLNNGENIINIKYKLPFFKIGIILSLIGIILFIVYKKIVGNKYLYIISFWLYNVLLIIMFIYYYFYSLFKYLL